MRIAQKMMLALATCLSMGSAMAAPTASTGTLNFSTNLLIGSMLLRVATPANADAGGTIPANTAVYDKATKSVSLTFDGTPTPDGQDAFTATNSLVQLGRLWPVEDVDGNILPPIYKLVFLKNLTIDLSAAEVQADISTFYQDSAGQITTSAHGRAAVFTIDVSGQLSGTAGTLRLASSATNTVLNGLYGAPGAPLDPSSSQIYLVGATVDWGVASLASAVPEPSTWALMLLGALPILAKRRTRAA